MTNLRDACHVGTTFALPRLVQAPSGCLQSMSTPQAQKRLRCTRVTRVGYFY